MSNDFIEGMQILINCKCYIEDRIEYLSGVIKKMDACGKDPTTLQNEINKLQSVLGFKNL